MNQYTYTSSGSLNHNDFNFITAALPDDIFRSRQEIFTEPVPELSYSPSGSSDRSENWISLESYSSTPISDPDDRTLYPEEEQWSRFKDRLNQEMISAARDLRAEAEKSLVHRSCSPPQHYSDPALSRRSSFSTADPDADGETDDTGSDDEYMPSPALSSRKCVRSQSPTYWRKDTTPVCLRPGPRPAKRARATPPPRNRPAANCDERAAIAAALNGSDVKHCPLCGTSVPKTNRVPDFNRHLRTHLPKQFWCLGVGVADASRHAIPTGAEAFFHDGQRYIGGCHKMFSRADALKRHLDNANMSCISSRTR